MPAPRTVIDLVERFTTHRDAYVSSEYNETQVRREFIDPLFKALGWDMDNEQGNAEQWKEVIHEDAIKIGGFTKAPDYSFRLGGRRLFFLEAKKPAVNIKDDPGPAFQLRRYAWTAKLPISILTDFEEFIVYDTRIQPVITDKSSKARILAIRYEEYADRWDEIASIFSPEAIRKGAFDKYVESATHKRGTATVDDAFLAEIEDWREQLARNIALRNSGVTQRELNFAVQCIIDRIVFLRICEDRGIEDYGRLQALLNGADVYARLRELFYSADERYNSGLFHFHKEKDREGAPDELTPRLQIDDKVLKDIFKRLYYPDCPYEFSVLPTEILGQVYERFLGSVIRLTAGGHAKVEQKPDVRKAGGVYYTPTYIVDYIVKHTVGRLLEGRTPQEVAGVTDAWRPSANRHPIAILDPACGSGSFLLGAYQCLLDWHLEQYSKDLDRWSKGKEPRLFRDHRGVWRLTTVERKRILLTNIFGVDIDAQAVEVTKLSLLLRVLEGENAETMRKQLAIFNERALPDLGANIKCGNSLIGPDFYAGRQEGLFDEEEMYRVNAFDWNAEFAEIMKRGGFDAVIGNPPYGALLNKEESEYLRSKFETCSKDLDTYSLFMEQSVHLATPGGRTAMIVPTGWYSGPKFGPLRRHMAMQTDPKSFVNLPYDVFAAWVDTTVFVAEKRSRPTGWPRSEVCEVKLRIFPKRHSIQSATEMDAPTQSGELSMWFAGGSDEYLTYADSASTRLIQKIQKNGKPLSEFADVQRGVTPFNLTASRTHATSRPAFGGTVRRYLFDRGPQSFIRFDDTLAEPKPERYFQGPRLLLRELISRKFQLQSVKVEEDFVTNKSMQSILPISDGPDLNYLLGVINSRLMSWYLLHRSNIAQRDDFPKIVLKETRSLPVPLVNMTAPSENAMYDKMLSLVQRILGLHKTLIMATTEQKKIMIGRQIISTDHEIDRLVYELYDLTEEEIRIVEEATKTD
ncbi:MAG: N-6 DNA methylase [Candidatus Krumholzibacteriia bacterium]